MDNSMLNAAWVTAIAAVFSTLFVGFGFLKDYLKGRKFILGKKGILFLVGMGIVIATVPVIAIAKNKTNKNEIIRQYMIDEDTRITKESEKCITYHVKCNSQEARQKITFYFAPPEIQNEIIMDAMDCARKNKLIFSPKTEINEYDQYKIVRDYVKETPTNIMPLLLTKDECLNITKQVFDAGGFNKDLLVLMRYILNERSVMRDLKYKFKVKSQEVILSYYDKIGIIAGFINMQKAKEKP